MIPNTAQTFFRNIKDVFGKFVSSDAFKKLAICNITHKTYDKDYKSVILLKYLFTRALSF